MGDIVFYRLEDHVGLFAFVRMCVQMYSRDLSLSVRPALSAAHGVAHVSKSCISSRSPCGVSDRPRSPTLQWRSEISVARSAAILLRTACRRNRNLSITLQPPL